MRAKIKVRHYELSEKLELNCRCIKDLSCNLSYSCCRYCQYIGRDVLSEKLCAGDLVLMSRTIEGLERKETN